MRIVACAQFLCWLTGCLAFGTQYTLTPVRVNSCRELLRVSFAEQTTCIPGGPYDGCGGRYRGRVADCHVWSHHTIRGDRDYIDLRKAFLPHTFPIHYGNAIVLPGIFNNCSYPLQAFKLQISARRMTTFSKSKQRRTFNKQEIAKVRW